MALSISKAVEQIKADLFSALPGDVITSICQQLKYKWRDRCLDPVTTIQAFLLQILHGNIACDHLSHLMGKKFSGSAYCQARSRLPLELFQSLLTAVCQVLRDGTRTAAWLGHRIWLIDGSTFSMPDTPALQEAFGQPGCQRKGCGFPVAHMLTLFDYCTGLLIRVAAAPLRTHDLSLVSAMHREMTAGDVVVGDRGFCSYAHLALLFLSGIHGVFRIHQATLVSFRRGRKHAPQGSRKGRGAGKGLPKSRWVRWLARTDQIVEYFKPSSRPVWMSVEQYAQLPPTLKLRELRYRVIRQGFRTKEVLLITTLLDGTTYSTQDLADLYSKRWDIETNLKHLKQTLGMDILHTKSVDNIIKELVMYVLVYNLVRLVMLDSSRQQQVPISRISFIDALRWLRHPQTRWSVKELIIVPYRPGRFEPRVRKRRPKEFSVMMQPREIYRKQKTSTCYDQT
jgi:hypothetical protein